MFTLDQIKAAHSQVKSGADFPKYIQDIGKLGVLEYVHFVADGHTTYYGTDGFELSGPSKWEPHEIALTGNSEKLKTDLKIHQQGTTSYPIFCEQAAAAGVEKWVVDIKQMNCVYYDRTGNALLTENIPNL